MISTAKPGAVLKEIRTRRGWTLFEVSQRTGLPVSTLSKVENGKMTLTYDKLALISKGLNIDIGQLFAESAALADSVSATGRRSLARAGEGKSIETPNYGYVYPAAELLNKRFVPIVAEVRAKTLTEFGELIRHEGEEYVFVLEGCVEVHTDLYAPVQLTTGESIYLDSGMGHAYTAAAPGPCRVLCICSGAESGLMALSSQAAGARSGTR